MTIHRYSEGCYRLQGRTVSKDDLDALLVEAKKTRLKRARICVHYDANDALQEMFVLLLADTNKGTYKYAKALSAFLMEGRLDYEFFTEGGELIERIELSKDRPFIKIEAGVYHKPILKSKYVLMHELHLGPWTKDYITQMK